MWSCDAQVIKLVIWMNYKNVNIYFLIYWKIFKLDLRLRKLVAKKLFVKITEFVLFFQKH